MNAPDPQFQNSLAERVEAAGLHVTLEERELLWRYFSLLCKWNERVNLTALPLDRFPAATIDRLLVEPMMAAAFVPAGSRWFDLGSGGGSPAFPLKILRPMASLTMVESTAKKAAFLREVARELDFRGAEVLTSRIEDVATQASGTADVITVRAVRLDAPIWNAIARLAGDTGRLLLFGPKALGDIDERFQIERVVENPATGTWVGVLKRRS